MNNKEVKPDISHLLRREIQTPLVAALIKGYEENIGQEKARKIAQAVIDRDAALSGRTLAKDYSGNTLAVMLDIVQNYWAKDGTMIIENINLDETTLSFDVTRCGYADMYKRLGLQEYGYLMSCSRDYTFMDGFNPDIKLERTKTIMQGDAICDFCYKLK